MREEWNNVYYIIPEDKAAAHIKMNNLLGSLKDKPRCYTTVEITQLLCSIDYIHTVPSLLRRGARNLLRKCASVSG